jgi:hypothetical protein
MAICLVVDNPDETAEDFSTVMDHVRSTGPVPPIGARLLAAGPADGGWRVVSIWESSDAIQRFFEERLAPAYQAAGLSLGTAMQSTFEVQTLVTR